MDKYPILVVDELYELYEHEDQQKNSEVCVMGLPPRTTSIELEADNLNGHHMA